MSAALSLMLARFWTFLGVLLGQRIRNILVVSAVLVFIVVLTLVPQLTVSACLGTGSCPCPGC